MNRASVDEHPRSRYGFENLDHGLLGERTLDLWRGQVLTALRSVVSDVVGPGCAEILTDPTSIALTEGPGFSTEVSKTPTAQETAIRL